MSKFTREKIKIPRTLKPRQRIQLAEVVLTQIVARTLAGYDKNGKRFKQYTEEYADKKGVDRSDVDLTLEGEMLDELELVSHKAGEITIGYKDPSDALAGKVEGNRIGSYGGAPDPKKARDYLGIDDDELDFILRSFEETEIKDELTDEEVDALARELASEMVGDL